MSKQKNKGEYSQEHTSQLYNRFLNLAINRFKWDNLPEGLTSRKIEQFLIEHGQVFFHKTEQGTILCLPCSGTKEYNIYNEPTHYHVFGNRYNKDISIDEGVLIRNNSLATCDSDDLLLFAERINEVEQTMDVNLFQQNTPYVFLCDSNERLTFKNILQQVKDFKYAIFGRKSLKMQSTDVLPTKAEYLLDRLQDHKTALMNELLTFLGINNSNADKKERLLVDEVNANNDFILVNIDHMFEERKKAVDEINKKFDLNIIVEKREVEFNGSIYQDTKGDIEE